LLIPGKNDSVDEVARLSDWCVEHLGADTPLHFSAFHPDFKLANLPPTPPETVQRARAQAKRAGLHHVYTGNIRDREGQSTYCAGCGELVIERDGYVIGRYRLDQHGKCLACGAVLAGHFDAQPGHFGSRRVRLTIASHP
jgi:pyruvate formate lyase activating enzyme